MKTWSRFACVLVAIIGVILGGCCATPPVKAPPPPISKEEQLQRLTAWSKSLPQVRAKTVPLGVELKFRNEKGEPQQQNAEGTLVFRQNYTTGSGGRVQGGNVLLLGTAFDQPVFEAGRNDTDWWFLIRLDSKTAWVGDSRRPVNVAALGAGGGGMNSSILRADLVLDLLGLSLLPGAGGPVVYNSGGPLPQGLLMRTNDTNATNEIFIIEPGIAIRFIKPGSNEGPFLAREVIVDRHTGLIKEVRLNDPEGKLVVRSEMSDYQPVTYAEGVEAANPPPKFPRKIRLDYPAQQMSISLQFDSVQVPRPLADRVFATPDFAGQNLTVIRAE